ncbi:MAG: hypothetical protein WC890_07450 [Candidatus Margulisiibacteriota bacterium]
MRIPSLLILPALFMACHTKVGPKVEDKLEDSGIPTIPVNPEDSADTGHTWDTGPQGTVVFPDDNWSSIGTIDGANDFFDTSMIEVRASFTGVNVEDYNLYITIGTNSTLIDGMPADGCFPGMINTTISDTAAEDPFCEETGYENFLVCPSYDANRLTMYLGEYSLVRYDSQGEAVETQSEIFIADTEILYTDPTSIQDYVLGVLCDGTPSPNRIDIPTTWNSEGDLNIGLTLRFYVETREHSPTSIYQTMLGIKVKGDLQ